MKIRHIVLAMALAVASVSATSLVGCDRGIQKYDTLVDKDEICTQKWGDYEAQLQRRADLIPSLVATVKVLLPMNQILNKGSY
jgi:hypothetical protein